MTNEEIKELALAEIGREPAKRMVGESLLGKQVKIAIIETDVYGVKAWHCRCMEAGCGWESKRQDRQSIAKTMATKHGATHFNQP